MLFEKVAFLIVLSRRRTLWSSVLNATKDLFEAHLHYQRVSCFVPVIPGGGGGNDNEF